MPSTSGRFSPDAESLASLGGASDFAAKHQRLELVLRFRVASRLLSEPQAETQKAGGLIIKAYRAIAKEGVAKIIKLGGSSRLGTSFYTDDGTRQAICRLSCPPQ
jgi:hypothetical protein